MDAKDLKEAIGKPHLARLKQIGKGIKVGKVLGSRVLVKTVQPWTAMDDVEKKGLLYVPESVKKENTPLPTTGVVLIVGPDCPCENCGRQGMTHIDEYPCGNYKPLINEGDMVMFPKFSGSDFNIENEDLRILEAAEIMCTLVDTEEGLTEVAADA